MVELQVPETLESKTMANSIYYKHLTDEHSRKSCWLPTLSYLLPPFKCLLWFFPVAFTHRTVFLRQDARPVNLNDSDIKANKQNEGNQISLAGILPVKPWLHEKKTRCSQSHKQGGETYKKNLCGQYANGRAPAGSESSQHWSEGYSCRRAQWTICNTVQWIIFPVDHGWEHPSMVLLSSQQRTSKGSFTFFISILEDLLPHDIYSTVYLVNIILQWRQYS